MKTAFFRSFTIILALSLAAAKNFASPLKSLSDTTLKPLLACVDEKPADCIVVKESNVEFPKILSGNEEQSIEYIEKFSTARKAYLVRTYNKSKTLFPKAAAILKKYDVPEEFKVLLALESGFNANAVSSAGAVGYWQIMDNVAREYGLKIHSKRTDKRKLSRSDKKCRKKNSIDERKNFERSTCAAARYLKDRCRNLNNDWLLITASYNWGVGNVWNAMERTGKENPTFWDIQKYLPAETKAYVMNFITLNVIFHNYEKFAENKLCFRAVTAKAVTQEEDMAEQNTSSLY